MRRSGVHLLNLCWSSMPAKNAISLLLLVCAPLQLGAVRSATQEDPDEEVTMIPVEEGDEVTVEAVDSGDVFTLEEDSSPVVKENEENPESQVQALVEIRTKLRFIGNQVGLRNPEMVPTLVGDINDQKDKHPDAKFAFCVHVGTSASENIKTSRPGFMEGRVQSLVDALAEQDLEVDASNAFEHFQSTRFAGLVMKVYTGETAPECTQEDLVPPPAGSSLVQVNKEDDDEEGETVDLRQSQGGAEPASEPDEQTEEGDAAPAPEADEQTDEVAAVPAPEPEEEEERTFIAGLDEEGTTLTTDEGGDGTDQIFTLEASPDMIEKEGITHLVEIRTKLKFKGNKVELRNPQLVPALVQDIKDIKEKHAGAKFVYCLHVGTSAGERIKTARPGFMEGRVKSLKDALAEADDELDVGSNAFEHFKSTRFAGLLMKVYTGDTKPECAKEDLVPPSA